MRINRSSKSIYKWLIPALILVVLAGGYLAYAAHSNTWPFHHISKSSTKTSEHPKVDTSPATQNDQAAANQNKQDEYNNSQQNNNQPSDNGSAKKKVNVIVSTYNQTASELNVNGFASGVVENGGTCTLILTDANGKTVSTTKSAIQNAQNTSCGQLTIPMNKLHSGTWHVSLTYNSSDATGTTGSDAIPPIEVS